MRLNNLVLGSKLQYKNLSYFDSHPITAPLLGKSFEGIRNFLKGLLFMRAIQKKKSMGFDLLRLNIQAPFCLFLTGFPRLFLRQYRLADFTSTNFPFQFKSAPLLNKICFAFRSFAAYFSHLRPIPVSVFQKFGFLAKYDFVSELFRKYQARLIQIIEQYFLRLKPMDLLHNKQVVIG